MSKGIMNRRDKMIWDNSALPTIDDVTGQISDLAESVAGDLEDAYEELDDKIDQAITDCTYTAGTNIEIDEDNVISSTLTAGDGISIVDNVISVKVGKDPYGSDMYRAVYLFTSVTGTVSKPLSLPANASNVYLISGCAKDSSSNMYPLDNNELVSIYFTPTTAEITVATDVTLTSLSFIIEYTLPQIYLEKLKDETLDCEARGWSPPAFTMTFANDCYVMCINATPVNLVFVTLEENVDVGNLYTGPTAYGVHFYTTSSYTYNGHTIYYYNGNAGMAGTYISSPSLNNAVSTNVMSSFSSVENALKAFIDNYF